MAKAESCLDGLSLKLLKPEIALSLFMFVEVLVSIADIDSYVFPSCTLYNIAMFWSVLNYSLGSLVNSVDL